MNDRAKLALSVEVDECLHISSFNSRTTTAQGFSELVSEPSSFHVTFSEPVNHRFENILVGFTEEKHFPLPVRQSDSPNTSNFPIFMRTALVGSIRLIVLNVGKNRRA